MKRKTKTPDMQKISADDQRRFDAEAIPHLDAVFNFSYSLTRDRTAAEDLAQETYLRALRGFHNFRAGSSAKAWLFKICRNLFIDRFRRRSRVNMQTLLDSSEPLSFDAEFDSHNFESRGSKQGSNVSDLFGDEVDEQLAELAPEFRQALILCDVEGLSYDEITEIMGTPIGTVRSRISRARSFLRERLEGYARDLGFLGRRVLEAA